MYASPDLRNERFLLTISRKSVKIHDRPLKNTCDWAEMGMRPFA